MKPLDQWTEQEIDLLAEGRETDAVVATGVMGWIPTPTNHIAFDGTGGFPGFFRPNGGIVDFAKDEEIPLYSSDIRAAYQVGERMRESGQAHYYSWALDKMIIEEVEARGEFMSGGEHRFVLSQASPLQRCKAALKAVRAQRLREVTK